jgi:D-ribulokinase
LGQGLTAAAAADLGLDAGTPVATGVIDAHAGGLGTVGAGRDAEACLAYVFGTSSCTMTTTRRPVFVPGVWGPYFSAMVPNTWLNEGGQSVAGAAIDRLLAMHPAANEARASAESAGESLPAMLARLAAETTDSLSATVMLAHGLHVVPEFLGNRAPFADPQARAVIAGLGMETGLDSLVALYVAGICGIGYGLRQIIEVQATAGASIAQVVISGGAGRSDLVRQLLADATRVPVVSTQAEEPVMLGAAMLGGVAGKQFDDVQSAMAGMSKIARTYVPAADATADLHETRFRAFERLQSVAREIRQG